MSRLAGIAAVIVFVLLWTGGAAAVSIDPTASAACQEALSQAVRDRDELKRKWATGELRGYNRWAGVVQTASQVRQRFSEEQALLAELIAQGDDAVAFAGSSSLSATSIKQSIRQAQAQDNNVQVERLQRALGIWESSIYRQKKEIETRIAKLLDVLAEMERDYKEELAGLDDAVAAAGQEACAGDEPPVDAPRNCDISGRYAQVKKDIASLTAAGERLRAYIERPLPETYEPDIPTICVNGDEATISYHGFWRQISDRAKQLNDTISFATSGASLFGYGWSGPEPDSVSLAEYQTAAVQGLAEKILDMGRTEILSMRDRTVPYRQGLEEYEELRNIQEQAQDAAEALRRHQICTVRRGLPAFYAGYNRLRAEISALRDDARACSQSRQSVDMPELNRLYEWHHNGAVPDRRGPDLDTGFISRGGWLYEGYGGGGLPPALTSVTCD